ncbi:MAG: hypothetical protein IKO10_17250 [Lachnospiraceae bacterium]|nr:hypothetical protein [Lachnospiraceae bacterium]
MEMDQKELENILSDLTPTYFKPEVVHQFLEHQNFLISGLDNKEEFRSRLAFTDAYKREFEEIHEKFREKFHLEKGDHEFDYLTSDQFRKATWIEKSVVYDMMKDYLTYQHINGKISKEAYENIINQEPKAEQEFRKQTLDEKEKDFLIDNSAFSDAKKQGLRDCRKWMYRNCSKSGLLNETGTKRNYIDSFGKRTVAEQMNTLYQVEKGHYKIKDNTGTQETAAMSDDYVPSLKGFKDKMVRGWVNPYRHWKKATGDCFYWSRMERALNKTTEMSEHIAAEYGRYKDSKAQIKQDAPEAEGERKSANAWGKDAEKNSDKMYKDISSVGKDYFKALNDYTEDRSDKNFKKVEELGHKIQQLYKKNAKDPEFGYNPQKRAASEALANYAEHIEKNVRKMDDRELKQGWVDKGNDIVDYSTLGVTVAGFGFTGIKKITDFLDVAKDGMEAAGTVFTAIGAVNSGVTMVKSGVMAAISQDRKKQAELVKKVNERNRLKKGDENRKNLTEEQKKNAKEAEEVNAAAKISKSNNKNKRNMYIVAGVGAGASCALGITSLAVVGTTVALPVTIAAGVVGGIGFGANYVAKHLAGKNPAKKSIDSQMKMEDKEYVDGKNENEIDKDKKGKRYIDVKMDERKYMVEEKQGRFRKYTNNYLNAQYYIDNPDKLKDRIRVNYAVKNGCMTMYTYRQNKDKENANIAYRHLFLKDPDGPIDENNLLKPEEVKERLSVKGKTGEERKDALKRLTYYNLLDSEGRKLSAPKNVKEAEKLFTARDPKEVEKEKRERQAKDPIDEMITDAEDARRMMGAVKQDTLRISKVTGDLLKRLEKAGEGNDKKGYKDLKDALTEASQLNERSTPREVRNAMRKLQEAGEAYKNSHNGFFQGIIGSGKERLKLAKEVGELGRFQRKVFKEKCTGMESDSSIEANIRKQDGVVRDLKEEKKSKQGPEKADRKEEIKMGAQKRAEQRQNEANSHKKPVMGGSAKK